MKNLILLFVLAGIAATGYAQNADSASVYYEKGLAEKQARRFREAELDLVKAHELAPQKTDILMQLADTYLAERRYGEAKLKFEEVLKLDDQNKGALENLATLSLNMHKWDDAIRYAQKIQALKIDTSVNYILAKSYYEQENYGQSLKYLELAYKDDPKQPELPYLGARCFIEMSNYKKAAGCFEQALALDTSNARWMYEAGLTYYAVPDDKKAIYWFQRAGEKGYKRTNDYIENLANAYLNIKDYDKGIALLQEVLARKPQDLELLYNVADAYYQSGKYQEAIDNWDKVLALDKTNAQALYMMGLAYQKKGDKEKGTQLCDKAIQMDPSLKSLRQERKMPQGL